MQGDSGDSVCFGSMEGLKDWAKRRDNMKSVCANCHASGCINNFYLQFDVR
jgi:hypothetical protein